MANRGSHVPVGRVEASSSGIVGAQVVGWCMFTRTNTGSMYEVRIRISSALTGSPRGRLSGPLL